ncbi:MAG: enoyl-CoA hydratase/isomerase family protein, partial [Solirubrobacteraceae bacterium]|nr:enoyl-CoA hydratase/isomerase family protein [Solirubrobacteraceae bacterium]
MPAVTLTTADGLATIELNRPEALNAWNTALGEELLAAVRAVAGDPQVRAVLVRGAGRAFSSGADLKDVAGRGGGGARPPPPPPGGAGGGPP